jgi:hypothetical protein
MSLRPLCAAAIAAAMGAISIAEQQPAPFLTGRVIDGDTGEPIAGATIHLSGRRTLTLKTNAEGRYQSGTLLPAMYTLTVSAEGYLPALSLYAGRVPLRLRVREDGIGPAVVVKDWMLERSASIRGRVLTEGDVPIAGVTVTAARRLRTLDGWPQLEALESAQTRANGAFEIRDLPRGAYVLAYQLPVSGIPRWFYSPGIIDPRHAAMVEATVGGKGQPVDLRGSSAPFPAVPVTAHAPGGVPAANTAIEVEVWNPFPSMSRVDTISTVTDSSGRGLLQRVPVGRHRLRARAPSAITAPAAARADVRFDIPAQIAGIDVRLSPAIPACVFLRHESDGVSAQDLQNPPVFSAHTRDGALDMETLEGRAQLGDMIRLPGLLPGSLLRVAPYAQAAAWQLTRFAPARAAERGVVPIDSAAAGCTAVYFRRASQFIRGRVVLGESEWVPDVVVIATPIDAPSAPVVMAAMTDDGTFHINGVAMGMQYEVIAVPAGYVPDAIPADLRHVLKANSGDTITIPLSLPIAR